MSILDHEWGRCHEEDIVWAEVSALSPERADRSLLMIWQGFFDESEKDGWFVLSGYLSTAAKWAHFTAEWAKLAKRFGRFDAKGRHYFHMVEQANRADAAEYLPALRSLINETVLVGLVLAVRPQDFRNAIKRIVVVKDGIPAQRVGGSLASNYYMFAFDMFLGNFSASILKGDAPLDQIDLDNDHIQFYFDERIEANTIYSAWEQFKKTHGPHNVLKSVPRFVDDKDFLPLQAADFLAYWFRRLITSAPEPLKVKRPDLFPFRHKKDGEAPYLWLVCDEEQLVNRWVGARSEGIRFFDRRSMVSTQPRG